MKKTNIKRLLTLAAVLILLCATFTGCFGGDPDETIDNLDNISTEGTEQTEAPTDPPVEETEPPTEAPTDPVVESVMGTVNTDNLNVRTEPSMAGDLVKQLAAGTRVEILEQQTNGDTVWGRIADGWVSMNYVTVDGDEPVETTPDDTTGEGTKGTVTASSLHIRKGAGSKYDSVGKYSKGDVIYVLEKSGNWGRTDKGWVSLKYVDLEGTVQDSTSSSTSSSGTKGTITAGSLHIRKGAGSSYDSIGKYSKGDVVYVLEKSGNWGRTDKGWISLKYVDLEGTVKETEKTTSSEVVTDGNTNALGSRVVTIGSLNVRCGPGTSYDKVDTVSAGEKVSYYQTSGSWIRIKEGWISSSSSYVYKEGDKGEGAGSGTITASSLNVRSGPGTGYNSVAKLKEGDKVEILAQITVGGDKWGYTSNGWVSMKYVKMAE